MIHLASMSDTGLVLQAVTQSRPQWEMLLEESERRDLDRWLAEAASGEPETVRRATNLVLDLLARYPQAESHVTAALGAKGDLDLETFRYTPPPGEGDAIPAGAMMVCPIDPAHYRKRLRQKGQRLFCPQHDVELVPEDRAPMRG